MLIILHYTEQPFKTNVRHLHCFKFTQMFEYVRVLFDIDDMKLILPVRGFQNCLNIQSELSRLADWCRINLLEPNVGKWLRCLIECSYMMGGGKVLFFIMVTLSQIRGL
jgi:hypothetical protein